VKLGESIEYALEHGYRLIDTAWIYGNQKDVETYSRI
jgi:diketogulonate reductase-like aldo/keto reductase